MKKHSKKPKIAVSIGDLNGISLELLITSHAEISSICKPFYFLDEKFLMQGATLLSKKNLHYFLRKNLAGANFVSFSKLEKNYEFKKREKLENFDLNFFEFKANLSFQIPRNFKISPGKIDKNSGLYSFLSFEAARIFVDLNLADALVTLPIHKKAWELGGLKFKGHTDALREFYSKDAIMMLGCEELFVGLFTEHIALKEVSACITFKAFSEFLLNFYLETKFEKIGILGFNPHAGDFGVIGGEEEKIMRKSAEFINLYLNFIKFSAQIQAKFLKKNKISSQKYEFFSKLIENDNLRKKFSKFIINEIQKENDVLKEIFLPNILVADTAFTKASLKFCKRLISPYHDLALAPLKALFFEKSVNISLNLPIIRTSVDHGTAFDRAYKNAKISNKSYKNAVKIAIKLAKKKQAKK